MFAGKQSEVPSDLQNKVTSKNSSSTDFSMDWHNYPWHKGKCPAIVSNGGRGTKAAKKSLKCCLT